MDSSIVEMLLAAAKLMLIGMGIVFLFLALLVAVIGLTARLLQRTSPEPELLGGLPRPVADAESGDSEIVAVIAAALYRFRNS